MPELAPPNSPPNIQVDIDNTSEFKNLQTLFEQWKAPDSPPNIQIENIYEDIQASDSPSVLTNIDAVIPNDAKHLNWELLDQEGKNLFSVFTSVGSDYVAIYSRHGLETEIISGGTKERTIRQPQDLKTEIIIGDTKKHKPSYIEYRSGEEHRVPLQRLFTPFPKQNDGLKYEPIFPHSEFSRLTCMRQSLGNEF